MPLYSASERTTTSGNQVGSLHRGVMKSHTTLGHRKHALEGSQMGNQPRKWEQPARQVASLSIEEEPNKSVWSWLVASSLSLRARLTGDFYFLPFIYSDFLTPGTLGQPVPVPSHGPRWRLCEWAPEPGSQMSDSTCLLRACSEKI